MQQLRSSVSVFYKGSYHPVRHQIFSGLSAACCALLLGTVVVPANAQPMPADTIDVIAQIAAAEGGEVAEALANIADVGESTDSDFVIDAEIAGADVSIPVDTAEPILLASGDRTGLEVTLPFADEAAEAELVDTGVVEFDNGNDSSTLPVVKEDGSVQILINIASSEAPTEYPFEFELPQGGSFEELADGSVLILDAEGEFSGGVLAPWAVDAEGNDVGTRFEIQDNTITQVVEHSESNAYPIVADPWLGINLISSVKRSWYSGKGYRYFVTPTFWGRSGQLVSIASRSAGWAEAKTYYSAMNTASIRDQFYCHWDYKLTGLTMVKSSWNLESWYPFVSYKTLIAKQCNL